MIPSPLAGAPAPLGKSWAKTIHDTLPLPDGRLLGAVPTPELTGLLVGLGIPGVSHSNGRAANASAYAAFLDGIRSAGAEAAQAAWLAEHGGAKA